MAGSILIVDDDVEFGVALSKILKSGGYDTQVGLNAEEGLQLIKKGRCDLVFVDLYMPSMDGTSLLKKIKKDRPGLPVVIITAFGDWDTYAEAVEAGADSFINKPVKKEEILRVVGELLGKRAA